MNQNTETLQNQIVVEQNTPRRYIPNYKIKDNLAKKLADIGNFSQINWAVCQNYGVDIAVLLGFLVSKYNLYEEQGTLGSDKTFYCTRDTLKQFTGWKYSKQEQLIKKFCEIGFATVFKRGLPPKRYFKLNIDKIIEECSVKISSETLEK